MDRQIDQGAEMYRQKTKNKKQQPRCLSSFNSRPLTVEKNNKVVPSF